MTIKFISEFTDANGDSFSVVVDESNWNTKILNQDQESVLVIDDAGYVFTDNGTRVVMVGRLVKYFAPMKSTNRIFLTKSLPEESIVSIFNLLNQ